MVGAMGLKKTDRIDSTAHGAASDLRAEASAPYLTDGEYGFLKASCGNAVDAVRITEYVGALEILHLAGAQTQYKPGKEPAHE
jgi:hypothetical protein